MNRSDHVPDDFLIGVIDDELTDQQTAAVRQHLAVCEDCKAEFGRLQAVSALVESAVRAVPAAGSAADRAAFIEQIEREQTSKLPRERSQSLLWRFGWSMGVAATIAVGVLLTAHSRQLGIGQSANVAQYTNSGTFEIDGETFVALPYSNPDIPLSGPRIVEMQVPVSSLADAGVVFEPISTEVASSNRTVLADVLLGADGQPLGVHVLESE